MQRLSDEQWERIREYFPEENIPDGRPGRKPVPARRVLDAVLWILNTGAQWHMLPQCYPNYKTVHRRFQQWCEREILREILAKLANELSDRAKLTRACVSSTRSLRARKVVVQNRSDTSRQGRQDSGHRRSQRPAAVGEHARSELSRSHVGATQFRLLHAGGETAESDRRPRV